MKRNWKIIVGAIFFVGGFGCISSDIGAAIFGIVVGAALTAWWILGRKKASDKKSTEKREITSPIPSLKQTNAQVTHRPTVQPAPQPAVQTTPQPTAQVTPRPAMQTSQTASHSEVKPAPPKTKDIVRIPDKKDGAALAYRYSVPFVPSDLNATLSAAKAERWYLSAKQVGKEIHLFSEEADLGILTERAEMVSDWIRKGDPYLVILERINSETGCTVMLVFYRDKQKYYANREQTVTALTGFKREDKQETILLLAAGDELEAEEDYEKEGRVLVSSCGSVIGSLPAKHAARFLADGAALIVFDHGDEDEESLIIKPVVKIYW